MTNVESQQAAALIARELSDPLTAAASTSWKWQLRDKDGQWIEMGTRVSWAARGMIRTGRVVGSPKKGYATVEDDKTRRRVRLPSVRLAAAGDGPARQMKATRLLTVHGPQPLTDETPDDIAARLRKTAEAAEPATTAILQRVVGKHGGQMIGLDFRLKTTESLVRKLVTKSEEKGISPAEYATKIGDTLRYTATMDPDQNIAGAKEILASLEAEGHTVISVENSWEQGDDYSGININMQAPNGVIWELQVHTPESYQVKEFGTHPFYEILRSRTATVEEKQTAYDQMVQMWRGVEQPKGWQGFGQQVFRYRRPETFKKDFSLAASGTPDTNGTMKMERGGE